MADGRARLEAMFAAAAAEGRAVLLPFMTAGLPDLDTSVSMFVAMAEAGADGFEVGIPYSDPLMDGPVIHEAGITALKRGADVTRAMEIIAGVVAATGKPVVAMTYVNPVLRVGAEVFARQLAEAGACGVILADLPADESDPFVAAFAAEGLGVVLFVAPTTDEHRLAQVVGHDPVFLYGIAELGVTGERTEGSSHAASLAERVRAVSDAPLVLGVGISNPEQAAAAATVADGVIVGTALVRRVLEAETADDAARSLAAAVGDLSAAVRSARNV
jgi:tryptophan synthase alpha chain